VVQLQSAIALRLKDSRGISVFSLSTAVPRRKPANDSGHERRRNPWLEMGARKKEGTRTFTGGWIRTHPTSRDTRRGLMGPNRGRTGMDPSRPEIKGGSDGRPLQRESDPVLVRT